MPVRRWVLRSKKFQHYWKSNQETLDLKANDLLNRLRRLGKVIKFLILSTDVGEKNVLFFEHGIM